MDVPLVESESGTVAGPLEDAQPLDRSSSVPLWSQMEAELRRRLDEGVFDQRFPTDLELTEAFGVSRHTAREAISYLSRDGLIERVRGRGTSVVKAEFVQPLGAVYSMFESIERQGTEQTSEVLQLSALTDKTAAAELGVEPGDELVFIERIRRAGGAPLAVDRAWIPLAVGEPLLRADFSRTSLYQELERIGVPRPTSGWDRIAPIVPDPVAAVALELAPGEPAFFVERLARVDGAPVEWRTTIIRGDRFRFLNEWSAKGNGDFVFSDATTANRLTQTP
ncbi:MAG: GntR family transcriptional regulator [Candidatus Poriferisodalaceae bacterium]|jgi:GntR family transcriptional regulator